ncbi:MAG: winged helix-turn-helix domain-containing protein, partial [Gemmatimonadales bacterium]|nr:winged helix-turn-helix domain-containing protein [Gemmatimonadales bacterium]
MELARTRYAGLNHSHLADLLAEREGITLERSTIRRILLRAGIRSPRPRRPPAHRSRRERMHREG